MKNKTFRPLLFRAAFCMMACDGSIADSELQVLKHLLEHSPYFDGLEAEELIKEELGELQQLGIEGKLKKVIAELKQEQLTEGQQFQLLEVLLDILYADGEVAVHEAQLLHQIRQTLPLSDEQLLLHFPKAVDCWLDLDPNETIEPPKGNIQGNFGDFFQLN
jgi:uncharacterized tellurite resistance protein B-like protein